MSGSISNSQNQELDNRNGFKSIKLGTSIERFDNYEIIRKTSTETIVLWTPPESSDLNNLFDDKIDAFSLRFNKDNLLCDISIKLLITGKYGDENAEKKYNSIRIKIESIIGKAKIHPTNPLSLWEGEKVKMYLSLKYQSGKMNDDDEFITLHSIDLIILSSEAKQKEENKSGF